ncbi:argininosuccinate lyase [Kibdelosporangium persicum]|uniref:argininosuccinate lyase n=1 Tax=Kibdelosporangium persicum TaxID=2698649 RepID=A0ABX2FG23_9PSEU|nr:argininosuccinate lyase [Kibdelosporangium persicum]NRN70328.1 DabB-Fusion protein containing a ligase and an argininosuccinate lyase [Kibdelosporangium persicum]
MTETGRLVSGLWPRTRQLVFGDADADTIKAELRLNTTVDLAHVTMLAESGLLDRETASALLRDITALRAEDFASLVGRPMPRGLYLMYENTLIDRLGEKIGGALHTARSRNDLKATTTALRLRTELLDVLGELVRLRAVLLARARANEHVVMPVYTHFQAAMPITYGYYLLGVALALGRECAAVLHAMDGLRRCPLGAGSVAGTDLRINPARTAALLGFDHPPLHALDSVASRDVPLRALSAVSGVVLVLSRMATDLQLWSTSEFGFLWFPDRLVGGSSAMPQKRNAFLLEHVKAKAGAVTGAWTAAAAMTKSTPFTNTIEVSTEAMNVVWPALAAVREAILLTQVLVSGARPQTTTMNCRAVDGYVTATAAANRLVLAGVPFRSAHRSIGEAVRLAVETGARFPAPADSVAEHRFGGGAGAFAEAFAEAHRELADHNRTRVDWHDRIGVADTALTTAARAIIGDVTARAR